MSSNWKEILSNILNPVTNKTLEIEGRWVFIRPENDELHLQYRRDGITPSQKMQIEESILKALAPYFSKEKIKIFTISDRSSDVFKSLAEKKDDAPVAKAETAKLQVGHGTVGNKRPVPGVKKVIAVASGKGGVGKSTFSVNLAKSIQLLGYKVGILDADIYGPSLPKLMKATGKKPYADENKKILPLDAYELKFISFGLFIEEGSPVIWRGPMLGGVLNQFLFDVHWGDLDVLIIDLPPGTGDVQLSMVQNCILDGAVIICTPQDIALIDAVKGLEMLKKLNVPILGMVENMSSFICDQCEKVHYLFGKDGVKVTSERLNTPYLGDIPLTLELRQSADEGVPFMAQEKYKNSKTWGHYLSIAKNIVDAVNL